jgi:hypothetical protein
MGSLKAFVETGPAHRCTANGEGERLSLSEVDMRRANDTDPAVGAAAGQERRTGSVCLRDLVPPDLATQLGMAVLQRLLRLIEHAHQSRARVQV